MKLVIILFLSFVSSVSVAQTLPGQDCKSEQILLGLWAFNRQFTLADGCLVQVTPINKPNLIYREYVFDQSGRMLVFDSTTGPFETATAQRNFFLLPATNPPQMRQFGQKVMVTLANGSQVTFAADSPFVESTSPDIVFREEHAIGLKPGGSFTIDSFEGILLDAGWAVGDRSYKNPEGESIFKYNGKTCLVKNHAIFAYSDPVTREKYYQPILKYSQPDPLAAFLSAVCGAMVDHGTSPGAY